MAIPPSIPTSFVPKNAAPKQYATDLSSAFNFFAYAIFTFVFLMALGVFGYSYTLNKQLAAKDQELAEARAAIDPKTAAEFIRLRDRLASSASLLQAHPAFSNFFLELEKTIPAAVRFTGFHITFDNNGVAHVDASGTAKSFNALAAASNALAKNGNIKDVIFSGLRVNRDSTVAFTLAATLDPSIIAFKP